MGNEGENKLTPMMLQYRQVKGEIPPGAILFFRLGDFYEMFFEDAQKASPILDVALTQRAGVPMCGIPYHALENYLPRLLEAGIKVAIAEQVEDPSLAKGLVKRKITRVITPGTMLDTSMLSPKQNNFLTAINRSGNRFGLAFLDISTGDFGLMELPGLPELETELHRLQSRECLLPESLLSAWERDKSFPYAPSQLLWTPLPDWLFSFDCADELLRRHFSVASLDGFGCRGLNTAVGTAGAILHYASENLRQAVGHVRKLRSCHSSEYMVLDNISQRNLELVEPLAGGKREGTLLSVLDETKTPMGSRLLRDWLLRPLATKDAINSRLDAVDALRDDPLTLAELREIVTSIRDLERIIARINVGSANARDMLALAKSLEALPGVKTLLSSFETPLLAGLSSHLHDFESLCLKIRAALHDDPPISLMDGGLIREGYNSSLDELRRAASEGKEWLASIQTKEQERTGIKSLKVRYNKVFGYYIEISKSNLQYAPGDYIRKQTLANCERFITPELKEIETKILGAEDKSVALEYELFQELRQFALGFTAEIQESAAAIAALDTLASLSECARKYNYCRPHISEEPVLDIKAGRHPVLDAAMKGERFVPNDLLLDGDDNRMMIITGPNMAG
ncbi:MAG: DNA mismatch repair protein MutS, partial [Lentisphaerae bacterium GWF2_52_8]